MSIVLALAVLVLADPPDAAAPQARPDQSPASPPATTASGDTKVGGVEVKGARAPVESTVDRRSYSVANDVQAATGSLADVLRDIPSVQVDLQGNISLRGDANITVLVDGKPSSQFSGETLAQALQSLPANQVDRIEVITNPSAEFRADGRAGVINLIMKKARGPGATSAIRVQAASDARGMAAASGGYNSNRLSTVGDIAYRRDHQLPVTDNRQALVDPATGLPDDNRDLSRGDLVQQTVNGHLGADYDLTPATRLSANLRAAWLHGDLPSTDSFEQNDDANAPVSAFSRTSLQQGTQVNGDAQASLRHSWSEGHDLTLTGIYDLMQYRRQRFDLLTPTLPAGADQTDAFGRHTHYTAAIGLADYEMPLPGGAKLKLGYDIQATDTVFEHQATSGGSAGTMTSIAGESGSFLDRETDNQAYVTYERPLGKLDTLVGLRAEALQLALDQPTGNLHADPDYRRLYPSLHLAYDLGGGRKATASYSRRVDRPSYALLDPLPYPQNPGSVVEGDIDLKPQDTDSYELGFETRTETSSRIATLYYRQTRDAFSYVYTNLPGGVLLQQARNAGDQRNGGLELVATNRLTPKLSYSLSADAYWSELSAANLGFGDDRQAVTGFGRVNLNWQATPKDFVQLNVFMNGETLLPQGIVKPFASGNIGYRHTVDPRLSWMVVVQDPFNTARTREVLDSIGGRDRQTTTGNNRMISLTLVWNFSGRAQATDFDFKPGGYGANAAP